MSFPTKEDRETCWGARDNYWTCLDKNNQTESVKDGPCAELRKLYEISCSSQWVKHFDRKRSYLQFKQKLETEGIPNKNNCEQLFGAKRRIYSEVAIT
ncbi:hypothetical protein RN001_003022 [Aquatica leii]|uniref:Cytochrome c oxidase assembly factor 6 n=1 Tax=Aquatica leii TaxID=1421715 RepID=A0AAN7PN44_9COLE|nr:hypothetical protein RN001_003022 [Aquatica leii]